MLEKCPIIETTAKIWKFLGYIETKRNLVVSYYLLLTIFIYIFQVLGIYRGREDIEILSKNGFFLALFTNTLVIKVTIWILDEPFQQNLLVQI